jgi:hypothetical protein
LWRDPLEGGEQTTVLPVRLPLLVELLPEVATFILQSLYHRVRVYGGLTLDVMSRLWLVAV